MSFLTANLVWAGDSITANNHNSPNPGFPELTATKLTTDGFTVSSHNIGVPSATCDSAGAAATTVGLYDSGKNKNYCLILFGANDGAVKTSTQFHIDLASFVSTITAAGFQAIILTMLPCGSYASTAFRAAINATTRSTYALVIDIGDTATVMGAETAENDGTLYIEAPDGVHPTNHGNDLLMAEIYPRLETLLGLVTGVSRARMMVGM